MEKRSDMLRTDKESPQRNGSGCEQEPLAEALLGARQVAAAAAASYRALHLSSKLTSEPPFMNLYVPTAPIDPIVSWALPRTGHHVYDLNC
ncbi:uncharacterized protein BO96DRAFT_434469 [Aspergillus niger CBS 101883]|uniref:Contig An18c0190, genomic contig n=2 Tax=Aspergillus niger TaxID=5061 RepID=A2RBA6_ASPNC|nr:uncharacterized protein BO96DRAFT_434469 [Aspergillus niger CBS 101883]XP_059602981.1 uncharacterized protein An18g06070 [Aspergillus niger]PYH56491.1 hypothetical protein BO96DRAFT_434469 [Aspergillus niger CBS 101883]CAK43330.1 unnamed protein product [Aspergillus niger]